VAGVGEEGRGTMESAAPAPDVLVAGELEIRPDEGRVVASGRTLTLSVREVGVLVALARRTGHIVRREALYLEVWGSELRPGDRSVDVYVRRLRAKLEVAAPSHRYLHTHVGFGYRFEPEPHRAAPPSNDLSPDVHKSATTS
jgi:DNA-binding response OmpR family regulator